jgi:WD40 repeat protein
MKCSALRGCTAILCMMLSSSRAGAQEEITPPGLEWKTLETPHFFVHYHNGAERTGRTVAKIAEEIYEPVTSLYNHKPTEKVSVVIRDYDDISNGAAYFFDNKIELYAPSMDFDFRGTHNWLRNVVTHEFTHIVQIQTSMKFGRRVPGIYLQWLGYESERRPDVLYGYPNVIVSYPVSGFVVPAWFAEGVAQYNRADLRYDFWDSHRDMILRSYALDSTMLSWEEMGVFGKTSLGNESTYNSGFAFVSYIAGRYGEAALSDISRNLATLTEVTIGGAIRRAVGKSGGELYDEWKSEVRKDYSARVAPIRTNLREGEPVKFDSTGNVIDPGAMLKPESMISRDEPVGPHGAGPGTFCRFDDMTGFANLFPAYSPDGTKFAYVSTKGGDYFSLSSLYVHDLATGKDALIRPGVRTSAGWSPDGTSIYYAKNTRDHPHLYLQFDIYRYDFRTEKETRITHGRRALQPSVSPDGKSLAYVVNADGTTNIALADADGAGEHLLTRYSEGEQVYNPKWSPSGDRIIFDYSLKDGRSIAEIRPDGSGLRFIITGNDDARTGVFSSDGSRIVFSSDRTGIFNLYSYDVGSGAVAQVTNVLGGAFCPSVNASGDIVYSSYTSKGYKIFRLTNPGLLTDGGFHYARAGGSMPVPPALPSPAAAANSPQFDWPNLRSYDDTRIAAPEARPYKNIFTSVTYVPFIRVDNYNPRNKALDLIKPGLYLFSNDVLDKIGFFAGAAINRQLERDLFLQFYYADRIPLLYSLGITPVASAEIYNVSRKTGNEISLPASTIPVSVTYDLLEFDFALGLRSEFNKFEFRYAHSRYTSIIDNFIDPETTPPTLIPSSGDLYLIANTLNLMIKHDGVVPSSTMDINPTGRRVMFRIGRELNKFNGDGQYEMTPSGLRPVYKTVDFTRLEMTWQEYIPFLFRNHTLTVSLRGGTIIGPQVDEFFDFYGGGLIGMKGYPFYSIGGNDIAVAGLTYRFPISNNLDFRFLQIYFDKLYASFYGDVGNAWGENNAVPAGWKGDAGAELRLETWSFYSYPTRIFVDAAYGFNRFDRYVRSSNQFVTYGKEWRFYFGILFNFDLNE